MQEMEGGGRRNKEEEEIRRKEREKEERSHGEGEQTTQVPNQQDKDTTVEDLGQGEEQKHQQLHHQNLKQPQLVDPEPKEGPGHLQEGGDKDVTSACIDRMPGPLVQASPGGICPEMDIIELSITPLTFEEKETKEDRQIRGCQVD